MGMRMFRLLLGMGLFLIITAAAAAQALRELPAPTGSYPIGARYLSFTDRSREELFTEELGDYREITAQVWYPAEEYKYGKIAPYLPLEESQIKNFGLPVYLAKVQTHAKVNAPIAKAQASYPVLIFNHGWREYAAQATFLCEDLASHGYFVFSLEHQYEAAFATYPNGKVVAINPSSLRWRQIRQEEHNPETAVVAEALSTAQTPRAQEQACRDATSLMPLLYREVPQYWAQDIQFLISELVKLDRHDPFFRARLMLDQIGVFGLSMGGLASTKACRLDKRIRAGMTVDGGAYGDLLDEKIPQSYMFINGDRYRGFDDFFLSRLRGEGYALNIANATHLDFRDLGLFEPEPEKQEEGDLDALRSTVILRRYVREFFDQCLKNTKSELLEKESAEFPEVKIIAKVNHN